MKNTMQRSYFNAIAAWVTPGARVLDLGCSDGGLLRYLTEQRGITGYGVEIDDANVLACVKNGVNVIQRDLEALQKCDAYWALPGWEKSVGARAEKAVLDWKGATCLNDPAKRPAFVVPQMAITEEFFKDSMPVAVTGKGAIQIIDNRLLGRGGAPTRATTLPGGAKERKTYPIARRPRKPFLAITAPGTPWVPGCSLIRTGPAAVTMARVHHLGRDRPNLCPILP